MVYCVRYDDRDCQGGVCCVAWASAEWLACLLRRLGRLQASKERVLLCLGDALLGG